MCPRLNHLSTISIIIIAIFLFACTQNSENTSKKQQLFQKVDPNSSGISFENKIIETEETNYYQYMYTYIGGGVAAADFNKDGLEDLFFISNSFDNKLYLNQGDFKFQDVSEAAGIIKREGFDAGVTVADVNQDSWPDIYISRGGWVDEDGRFANMLYINQGADESGNISFIEKAAEHGLADTNRGIQSTFFDYDKDGDLDVYISNTPDFEDRAAEVVDLVEAQSDPKTFALKGSDKLYQNDGTGHFEDVSTQAGIMPDIGFGLNPQVGDLNQDGWLDIYVCNDFRIPDFAYINNGDGTFREGREAFFKHLSFNSMGGDIADINNDGLFDLYTLDMNPEDYVRSKTTMGMTSISRFQDMIDKNYHYNYMHNMLQINNGNGTFREVSNLSGIANTDWSWACLMADFDLDGHNDVFVTNGVYRDVIDRDANNKILSILREKGRKPTAADFLAFTQMLPQQKLTNYLFKNNGDLTFEDVSETWMDAYPTFSNGAVYADLDNDGDLDLAVNNINEPASILKNQSRESNKGNYISLIFDGQANNKMGVGAIAKLKFEDGQIQTRQLMPTRGFLSSVSPTLHFGIGNKESIKELEITWMDGKNQTIKDISVNQTLAIKYSEANEADEQDGAKKANTIFKQVTTNLKHTDPSYNDYELQILLPHKLSQTGPAVAVADVNGDGWEDVFIGGGHTQAGQLLLGNKSGNFSEKSVQDFTKDRQREDVGACFFDYDNDGDNDLYVVSGSYEFPLGSKLLIDRLYENDGKGNFTKTVGKIPEFASAGSIVTPKDIDGDGDIDLFVGSRVVPGHYPIAGQSLLLENEGGIFSIVTEQKAPDLEQIGLITDAVWHDIDNDEDPDLILAGEWMGIEVFLNERGTLAKSEMYTELSNATGWWNKLEIADIDGDGDSDIIAGNLGLNYKFHASTEKPFHIYTNDFDYNGTTDVFLAKNYEGKEVPIRGKTCATQQLPHLAEKIPTYNDFASRDMAGILGPSIQTALHYEAVEFRSGIFINNGQGNFSFKPFELEAQQAPINSILYADFDGDGISDLLMAGNNYMSEVETTRADAGIGNFLKGKGDGAFEYIPHLKSGFFANKDVRNMVLVNPERTAHIFVINNNETHDLFMMNHGKLDG